MTTNTTNTPTATDATSAANDRAATTQIGREPGGGAASVSSHRGRTPALLAVGAANVLTVAVLGWAAARPSPRLFGVAVAVVLVLLVIGAAVRSWIDRLAVPAAQRWRDLVLGSLIAVIGGGLVARWFHGGLGDGWGFLGASVALLGAGHALLQLRSLWAWRPWRGPAVLAVCAALVVGGLVVASPWAGGLLLAGILLSPVGVGLSTEDALDRIGATKVDRRIRSRVLVGGIGVVATGVAGLMALGLPPRWAFAIGLVVVGLVGAVASKTTADAVLVVAVIAVAWAAVPRSVPIGEEAMADDGETVMVAVGDSFMSGEGADHYYAGTNVRHENECRRAPTAYPVRAVRRADDAVPDDVVFLACSGAKARHIYHQAQYPGEPAGGAEGGLDQLAQLRALREQVDIEIDLVIVSVGGNDAGFGEVAQTCLGPGDCSALARRWLDALDGVGPPVAAAYAAIRTEVGPDVPVLVVPYPVPLNPDGCSSSALTSAEHRFLHTFAARLDGVLRRTAAEAGFYYLDEMVTALEREQLRVCDGDRLGEAGVNFLAAHPVEGLVREQMNPLHWFHNSLHPNELGHRTMADTLVEWIDRHPDLPAAPPTTSAALDTTPSDESSPDELAAVDEDTGDWVARQSARLAWRAGVPLLLVLVGAWVLWVHLFWWLRAVHFAGGQSATAAIDEDGTRRG